jgi:hypothetical protein
VDSAFTDLKLFTGALQEKDFGTLGTTPPPGFSLTSELHDPNKASAVDRPGYDANYIAGAGATLDSTSVLFQWFDRKGTPIALNQPVYTTATSTVVAAEGAPVDLIGNVAVWTERDGASPPNFNVKAQRVLCALK